MKDKLIKLSLALGSFGIYTYFLNWKVALVLIVSVSVHELGHVLMMNRRGIPNKGFYLVPFLGAATLSQKDVGDYDDRCWVALTGSFLGYTLGLVSYILYDITKQPVFLLGALYGVLGLINLLPIPIFDGWHAFKAMTGKDEKFRPMTSSQIKQPLISVFWFCVSAGLMLHTIGWSGLKIALQFIRG